MAFVTALPLARTPTRVTTTPQRFVIRAAKHVQFKGAKKADRCRPKKHRPSDKNRAPPSFNPEPLRAEGLPPVLEVFKPDQADAAFAGMTTLVDAAMVAEFEKGLVAEAESQPVTAVAETVAPEPEPETLDPEPESETVDPEPVSETVDEAVAAESQPSAE